MPRADLVMAPPHPRNCLHIATVVDQLGGDKRIIAVVHLVIEVVAIARGVDQQSQAEEYTLPGTSGVSRTWWDSWPGQMKSCRAILAAGWMPWRAGSTYRMG